jgi:hypothetical protein
MKSRVPIVAVSAALAAFSTARSSSAAQEGNMVNPTTQTVVDVPEVGKVSDAPFDRPGPFRSVTIGINPLAFVIARVSLDFTYSPIEHHAIVVSPHFQSSTQNISLTNDVTFSQHYTGGGGEVGYRYYTGHRGANGFFIGGSFIMGWYKAELQQGDTNFTNFGGAVDVGVQTFLADNFTVGVGAGLQWTHVSQDFGDLPFGASTIAGGGLKPRLLASAGAAF